LADHHCRWRLLGFWVIGGVTQKGRSQSLDILSIRNTQQASRPFNLEVGISCGGGRDYSVTPHSHVKAVSAVTMEVLARHLVQRLRFGRIDPQLECRLLGDSNDDRQGETGKDDQPQSQRYAPRCGQAACSRGALLITSATCGWPERKLLTLSRPLLAQRCSNATL
jgi:hypothetical protein